MDMERMKEIEHRIWSAPLTDNEREIIARVLDGGSLDDTRSWLRHVLKVYDAREKDRGDS